MPTEGDDAMMSYRWLAASVVAVSAAAPATAQKADVIHFYTSSGESLAIGVFAKEYDKRGGTWVDDPAVGPQAESALAMNRIAGGNPPTAMQWPVGAPTRELNDQGMLTNLDDLAAAGNWAKNLPPLILRNVVFNGHFVTAPVDIHGANWMFFSTKVFKAANLEPPKTWDEFFEQAPKLQAAGYIPLAYGANAQQVGWLFMALLAGVAGSDTYMSIAVQHDAKAAGSDGVRKVFETMGRLRQYVDAGSPNRKWNDTLALVETNKAALMIVGDWAKGDLAAANLKIDEDWGCALAPGSQDAYIMQTNSFAFPKTDKPDQVAAQRRLAEVLMDPAVQTEYTFYKGSIPSRQDANIKSLDRCAQLAQKVMAEGPAHQLPHFILSFTPDVLGQIYDVLGQFWSHPDMSPPEATRQFAAIVGSIPR
jgi:glucose/mannose transport system substrate-binding protein